MRFKEGWGVVKENQKRDSIHFAKFVNDKPNIYIILNDAPICYEGHFTAGIMLPCDGDKCKMCQDGLGKQIRYAFGAYEIRTGWRVVLELSHKQANIIFDRFLVGDSSRGLKIEIARLGLSKQANLQVRNLGYIDLDPRPVYSPVNVGKVLSETWKKHSYIPKSRTKSAHASGEGSQDSLSDSPLGPKPWEPRNPDDYTPF